MFIFALCLLAPTKCCRCMWCCACGSVDRHNAKCGPWRVCSEMQLGAKINRTNTVRKQKDRNSSTQCIAIHITHIIFYRIEQNRICIWGTEDIWGSKGRKKRTKSFSINMQTMPCQVPSIAIGCSLLYLSHGCPLSIQKSYIQEPQMITTTDIENRTE